MSFEHCNAPCNPPCQRSIYAGGLCSAHYVRKRTGKDITTPIREMAPDKICSAPCNPPCYKHAYAKGLCVSHYQRFVKGKAIDTPIGDTGRGKKKEKKKKICKVYGCENLVVARGQCWKHYRRELRLEKAFANAVKELEKSLEG